jgi:hypothetical protein
MPSYYVSRQRGSDSNSGTSQASPWLTLGYAIAHVAAGDTVYIGPGLYRENALTFTVTGTAGAPIKYVGDPTCMYLTGDNPGTVHLTRYDASWHTQAGPNFNISGVSYNYFYNLVIDGSALDAVTAGGTENNFYYCSIEGSQYGVIGAAILWDCYVGGGQGGVVSCTTNRCVLSGASKCANAGNHYNTLAIGGNIGFSSANCYNCTATCPTYGFFDCQTRNCSVMSAYYGFYGAGDCVNGYAKACRYGYYGTAAGSLTTAGSLWSQCLTVQRGSGYETGTITQGGALFVDWTDLRKWMEPWYTTVGATRMTGDNTYLQEKDILLRSRPSNNGTTCIGIW